MGGIGSGSWDRLCRKSTTDQCLTLDTRDIRKHFLACRSGSVRWTWTNGSKSSIGYTVGWIIAQPRLTLKYRWNDEADVQIPILLQQMPMRFGGERWFYTCPLIVSGVPCNRRVCKLYLAPGSRYFGCRHCHALAYRSSQEAHSAERATARLGRGWARYCARSI